MLPVAPARVVGVLLALLAVALCSNLGAQPGGDGSGPGQLRLGSILGGVADPGFARAEGPRSFRFPQDHGPHPRFRSEWWYLTANLRSAADEPFGVQFTAFRQALHPPRTGMGPWLDGQIYLAHLAVTDVARARHREAERLVRGHPQLAGARAQPFRVWVDGWSLESAGNAFAPLRLAASSDAFAVQLELDPLKPVVLQGQSGLSTKGPGQASYYYSLPRLDARGELRVDGRRVAVNGSAWLDREWSTSVLAQGQVGWDWFGLQLDGNEELMLYRLRRSDGRRDPFDQGSWVAADGRSLLLGRDAFTLRPERCWRDRQGVCWPVAWQLSVVLPSGRRELRVEAMLDDQRMDTLFTYWEGAVRVLDAAGHAAGVGYMELTGYE
ncbi:MAG: lipocalin-like domain-containing protein [Pseudomonadales bacterium]